jgi:hypothetical protein
MFEVSYVWPDLRMPKAPTRGKLAQVHSFPDFRAGAIVHGRFGISQIRIHALARRTIVA